MVSTRIFRYRLWRRRVTGRVSATRSSAPPKGGNPRRLTGDWLGFYCGVIFEEIVTGFG